MGGAVSKTTRKLPTKPRTPWAGAATPMDATAAGPSSPRAKQAGASETKTEAIEKDSRDPQFMANLSALGQVKVDHHMATYKTNTHMQNILHSQQLSEQQASSTATTRNRILAGNMVDLLEERRHVHTRKELEKLSEKYGLDVDVLENVEKNVSNPGILGGSERTVIDEDGEERVTVVATWVENPKINSPSTRA